VLIDSGNKITLKKLKQIVDRKLQNNKYGIYISSICKFIKKIYIKVLHNDKNEKNIQQDKIYSFENNFEGTLRKENSQRTNFCEKPLSKSVIDLTRRFNKIAGYESEIIEKCVHNFSSKQKSYEKYILFAFFLIKNAKGDVLPKNADIDMKFGIEEWERKNLKKKLIQINFLIKVNRTTSIINKEHELFLEYQKEHDSNHDN
jgi:hypothetical protein